MSLQKVQIKTSTVLFTTIESISSISFSLPSVKSATGGAGYFGASCLRNPVADIGGSTGGSGKTTQMPYAY